MSRRGLRNVSSLRRKLRNMEKVVESGIRPAIEKTLQEIAKDAKQLVPKDTGALAESINFKVSGDGLAGVAGPSAKTAAVQAAAKGSAFATRKAREVKLGKLSKERLFQFFKGYWIEFGTKGSAERNIPPMPARPFMSPAFDMNRKAGIQAVSSAVNKQLKRLAL